MGLFPGHLRAVSNSACSMAVLPFPFWTKSTHFVMRLDGVLGISRKYGRMSGYFCPESAGAKGATPFTAKAFRLESRFLQGKKPTAPGSAATAVLRAGLRRKRGKFSYIGLYYFQEQAGEQLSRQRFRCQVCSSDFTPIMD